MHKQPATPSTASDAPQRYKSAEGSHPEITIAPSGPVLPDSGTRFGRPDERPCGGYMIGGGTFDGGFMLGSGN